VKRGWIALAALAALVAAAAVVYQVEARERTYRRLMAQGDASFASGQTFSAIDSYGSAIALRPDSMLAHLRRGETYRLRGDLEAAALDLRAAAALDPAATRPLEQWGDVLYQQRRYRRAAEVYDDRLKLDDRSAAIRTKLGLALYRAGNLAGALPALEKAAALDSRLAEPHYLMGLCLKDLQRPIEAIAAFEQAVNREPGSIPSREELADLYETIGKRPQQIEQLQVLAVLDPNHIERRLAVGLAHARAGHAELAVLTLANAIEQAPEQPLIYGALGRVWLDIAESHHDRPDALAKALEALERAASSPTATSEVKTLYGRALMLDRQSEAAERVLQQATERSPADPRAFAEYAIVAEEQQHFAAARAALLSFTALVGDTGDAAVHAAKIGQLSLRLNDTPAAVQWLRRAALSAPDNVDTMSALAEAEFRAGNLQQARAAIEHAVQLDPGNARLRAIARRLS
jgi:tetratricopeptide (TPR) repeat protein